MKIDEIELLARAVKLLPSHYLCEDSDLVILGNRTSPRVMVENKYLPLMIFHPYFCGKWQRASGEMIEEFK